MTKFKGKNGVIIIVLIIIYNLLPVYFFITDFNGTLGNPWYIVLWVLWYSFNILFTPSLFRNRVELYEDYFIFYYGIFKRKYKISDIMTMSKARGFLASTANSMDRIHIVPKDYNDFCISLKDNDEFIKKFNDLKDKINNN